MIKKKSFDKAQDKKIAYIPEEEENSDNKLKKSKNKLKQCQKEKEDYLTQAQIARADLINYRRRQEEKIIPGIVAIGQTSIIHKILPILDSLEAGSKKNEDIKKIKEQMINALKECNIEEIKAVGEKFDPEFHEAVEQIKSDKNSGIIIQQVQKGYLFNNKLLRPSKVKIAK